MSRPVMLEKPQTHKLAPPFNGTDGGTSGHLPKGVLTLTPGDKRRISAAVLQLGLLAQVPSSPQVSQEDPAEAGHPEKATHLSVYP